MGSTEERAAVCYSDDEMMALTAGSFINNDDIVFAGTGISMLAATVAKRIYAPRAVIFFETGGIDPALDEIPMAVADPRVMSGTALNASLIDAFSIIGHRRLHTIAFLGAAQIDRYGNLNTTVIGDYHRPRIRFSGSGGSSDAASLAAETITFMQQKRTRFVEKLDYLTSVGWHKGGDSRERLGLKRGGPRAVVTNLGVMKFNETTKEMYLASYYPGVNPERIAAETGFELDLSRAVEARPPSAEDLRILRDEVDPQRLILHEP